METVRALCQQGRPLRVPVCRQILELVGQAAAPVDELADHHGRQF